jgi:hypothetical protein
MLYTEYMGFFALRRAGMTAEQLSMIAGVVLSLAFSYVPGLKTWYAALEGTQKRLVMLCVLLASALGIFGLSCAKLWVMVACSQQGALQLVEIFFTALISNQATFLITPVKQAAGDTPEYEWRR